MARILIVDDSPSQLMGIRRIVEKLGHEALTAEDEVKLGVSVNGKPPGELVVSAGEQADQERITALALALPRVAPLVAGKTVRRFIFVPGKMLNLVVS